MYDSYSEVAKECSSHDFFLHFSIVLTNLLFETNSSL